MGHQKQAVRLYISLRNSFPVQLYCFISVLLLAPPVMSEGMQKCSEKIIFEKVGNWHSPSSSIENLASPDRYKEIPARDIIPRVLPFNTSDFANMTEGQFVLNLTNSGPAVLDSEVKFRAVLLSDTIKPTDKFLYQWKCNTTKQMMWYTRSRFHANLSVKFERPVSPAGYEMRVCVYLKTSAEILFDNFSLVAQGSMDFTLTELLNGRLKFKQTLPYQKHNHVFETGKPLTFYTELLDKFQHKLVSSNFYWYRDGTLFRTTATPHINVTFNVSTDTVANVVVVHTYRSTNFQLKNLLGEPDDDYLEKMGTFTQKIFFKEPLSHVRVAGDKTVKVDDTLPLNVSYKGSSPINLCWSVHSNCSQEYNITCQPTLYSNATWVILPVTVNTTGQFTVKVTLKNDVSIMEKQHFLHAYDPESLSSPSAALPIVCSLLGLMFIVAAVVYVLRQQKKKPVEVAAYDFHPTLTAGNTHPLIRALKENLFKLFHKEQKHEYSLSTEGLYGSTSDTESLYSEIL